MWRMHDIGVNCWVELKRMYRNSLVCVRVKGGENEWFKIDSRIR